MALEVLSKVPRMALPGTTRVAVKVQELPGPKVPPVKETTAVPVSWEPTPQTSFWGRPTAAKPASTAFRSSLNASSVRVAEAEALVMVYSKSIMPPGSTGLSRNCLLNTTSSMTSRVAVAVPLLPALSTVPGSRRPSEPRPSTRKHSSAPVRAQFEWAVISTPRPDMQFRMELRSSPWHRLETWALPDAMELSRMARWDIDLSPGRVTVPSSRAAPRTVRIMTRPACRGACSLANEYGWRSGRSGGATCRHFFRVAHSLR